MLKQRVITAIILAPIVIGCVFLLPLLQFSLFIAVVMGIAAWEWANLVRLQGAARVGYAIGIVLLLAGTGLLQPIPILIAGAVWWLCAFYFVVRFPAASTLWSSRLAGALLGVVVFVPGFVGLVQLKQTTDATFLILLLFLLIWGADIGAYFAGRAFGRSKLAPAVSPGKSWAGLYGGLVSALVIAAGMALWYGKPALLTVEGVVFLIGCGIVVLVSVLGDLVESMFKRQRGVKDSSNLLPGHGGVLDRIDSLLSAGPLFALFILLFGWT
jgi:phosphatidate cytidylyltransferase